MAQPIIIIFFFFFFFFFFSVCFCHDDEINREMLLTKRDIIYPPIDNYPTSPVTIPPDTTIPTPTIVNVPSTNPIIDQPPTFPVTVPSTTVPLTPITNPVTSPVSVPGTEPVTNPVTTYPNPSTGVPVTTPVTTYPIPSTGVPVTTPVTTPSVMPAGQSWCVAKSGTTETALQSAIDYACGIGGADCSAIQEGASCYNPNTLEYHASYAFNSYYQMNPVQTSCDFQGAAMIAVANPSTGTCVFPASSSSVTSPAVATPTTSATTGVAVPSTTVSPPTVVNTSYPGLGGGGDDSGTPSLFPGESPPIANNDSSSSSISTAVGFRPSISSSSIILVTAMVTRKLVI